MRTVAKVDGNQEDLVAGLRKCGVTVQSLSPVGSGVPDLLCGWQGRNYLIEIKDPTKDASHRALTPDQVDWHRHWNGQVATCETLDDCLVALGIKGAVLKEPAPPRRTVW